MLDKSLIERRFAARLASYNKYASVQNSVCEHLGTLADRFIDTKVDKALEIGAGTGFLTSIMTEKYPAHWFINDITPQIKHFIDKLQNNSNISYVFGDAEHIDFEKNLDLVVSSSAVQWFDDFSAFLGTLGLKSDKFAIFSSFGTRNFEQIKNVLGVGLKYQSLEDFKKSFTDNKFEIIYSEQQIINIEFDSAIEVLKHIKLTGVNSIENFVWTRKKLDNFCKNYQKQHTNDQNKVILTYNPIIVVARKL